MKDMKGRLIEIGQTVMQSNRVVDKNKGAIDINAGERGEVMSLARTRAEVAFAHWGDGRTHNVSSDYLLIVKEVNGKWTSAWDEEPDAGRRLRWESNGGGYDGLGRKRIRLFSLSFHTDRSDPKWLMRCSLPGYDGKVWKHDELDWHKDQADRLMLSWARQMFPELAPDDERSEAAERVKAFLEARAYVTRGPRGTMDKSVVAAAGNANGEAVELLLVDLEKLVEGL
ncbi:hypothetical protein [Nonomuraea typhae]|uniref:Uncharacterized protein n=1 Tax=Nonomuraea typhae TaxID=2603600 RepID=A0ABW7YK67_9ACTN